MGRCEGSRYVFKRDGNQWHQDTKLLSQPDAQDHIDFEARAHPTYNYKAMPTNRKERVFVFLYHNPGKRYSARQIAREIGDKHRPITNAVFDLYQEKDPRIKRYPVKKQHMKAYYEYEFTHQATTTGK